MLDEGSWIVVHCGAFRVREAGAAVSAWCDFPMDIKLLLRSIDGVSVESDVAVVGVLGSAPMVSASCVPYLLSAPTPAPITMPAATAPS